MSLNTDLRREINRSIDTLTRRFASSSDPQEKTTIMDAIGVLNGELSILNQAALLEAAASLTTVSAELEKAVAAARVGPFDGYLAALEEHLQRLNQLSGAMHDQESLPRAVIRPVARAAAKRGRGRRRVSRDIAAPQPVSTKFPDLHDDYDRNYAACEVRPEYRANVNYYLMRLRNGQANYQLVESALGIPWLFVGVIHAMECGFNFSGHMHNGDPLTARTTHVPQGRPAGTPPFTWLQSAVDAMRYRKLDQVTDWSVAHMLYLLEAYNGFGYRKYAVPTPYLWSFSTIYSKGKFVQDRKFDPDAVSRQCGAALMIKGVRTQ